jgi:hypothetical protein
MWKVAEDWALLWKEEILETFKKAVSAKNKRSDASCQMDFEFGCACI